MAWPFSNVSAPNLDTTPGQDVPVASTVVFSGALWLLGGHFANPTVGDITLTVTDAASGALIGPSFLLPAGTEQPFEWPLRPATGVKWNASSTGLKGHLWGYQ